MKVTSRAVKAARVDFDPADVNAWHQASLVRQLAVANNLTRPGGVDPEKAFDLFVDSVLFTVRHLLAIGPTRLLGFGYRAPDNEPESAVWALFRLVECADGNNGWAAVQSVYRVDTAEADAPLTFEGQLGIFTLLDAR